MDYNLIIRIKVIFITAGTGSSINFQNTPVHKKH